MNRGGDDDLFHQLFESGRLNAILSWAVVAIFLLVLGESIWDRDLPWIAFTAVTTTIILLPPLSRRSVYVMLPWELLLVASFPMLVRGLEVSTLANTFATFLAMAALALIVTTELHVLSRITVTHWFAITFVVLATLAIAGAWAIVRWHMDRMLDTALLTTNDALMIEFAWVLLAGLVAGIAFDLYFRRRSRRLRATLRGVLRR